MTMGREGKAIIAALAVVMVLMVYTCTKIESVATTTPLIVPSLFQETEHMGEKTTTWCFMLSDSVKGKHTVTTTKGAEESNAEWRARHKSIVDADKIEYVPVSCD